MLYKNDLYKDANHRLMRLLTIDPRTQIAWVIDVQDGHALPEQVSWDRVRNNKVAKYDNSSLVLSDRASAKAKARRDKAWKRIEPLVSNSSIYPSESRGPLVKHQAEMLGCSPQTLMKDLRRWWQGGQTLDALLGHFNRCGKSKNGIIGRRGRKPRYQEYEIYALAEQDLKNIQRSLKQYLKKDVATLASTYQSLLNEYYSYLDGNGDRYLRPLGEKPSFRQFQYHASRLLGVEQKLRRKGDKKFELNHRAKLGRAIDACHGIGHIYEIDATIADVFLVSSRDRSKIIGKPTLYLIRDRKTYLTVGWYVGLESASWMAAMNAIISIAEDKEALCKRYNVPYDPADWPADGVFPQVFFGDRGEMLSANSNLLCDGLAITVANAPSCRGDRKGTVECGFKLIHQTMAPNTPGYEPSSNYKERQGKKYDRDASLNLHEFCREILLCIITQNRKLMKDYPLTAEQLLQGVQASPIELWNYECTTRSGLLTRYPVDFVRFKLMPRANAVITQQGIQLNGCYYHCREAVDQGWYVKAGIKQTQKAVRYDPRLVDQIYLEDPADPKKYITATLTARSEDYRGLSFDEVAVYEYLRAKAGHIATEQNYQVMSEYDAHSQPVKHRATEETLAVTKGKSRRSRKADIKGDRTAERREQRQVEARMPEPDENDLPLQPECTLDQTANTAAIAQPMTLQQKMQKLRQGMLNG